MLFSPIPSVIKFFCIKITYHAAFQSQYAGIIRRNVGLLLQFLWKTLLPDFNTYMVSSYFIWKKEFPDRSHLILNVFLSRIPFPNTFIPIGIRRSTIPFCLPALLYDERDSGCDSIAAPVLSKIADVSISARRICNKEVRWERKLSILNLANCLVLLLSNCFLKLKSEILHVA